MSGNAANVHPLGWVESGAAYSITFDADFTPATAVSRIDLDAKDSRVSFGSPDLDFVASSAGTMALYVSANGASGCYRYKVVIESPGASSAGALESTLRIRAREAAEPIRDTLRDLARPAAISGLPSSAKHCVAGNYVANVHSIGRVESGTQIRVTFSSDFDSIAGMTNVNPEGQQGGYLIDDNGGGGREPLLNATTSSAGTLALFVAGVGGAIGCYQYKVEITAPTASSPTPSGVALSGTVAVAGATTRISGATVTILDGSNSGRRATTNSSGEYRFDGLTAGNANVAASASGFSESRLGVNINGTNTLNFALQRSTTWSQSGTGNNVFDMPSYVSRVRITGTYTGFTSNFIVRIGGRLVVNELLGTGWPNTRYDGVHATTGGVTEITNSSGVSWTFTEVR